MDPLITIPALGDNLIYLYRYGRNNAFVVDPSDGLLVLRIIEKQGLKLTDILVTHHHWDHIAGAAELKRKTDCRIMGGDERRIPGVNCVVRGGDVLTIGDVKVQVIATPGHTCTSLCYCVPASSDNTNGILWTGDTLFVGGCGRIFECDAQSMWDSLLKLASLPDQTLVYCGHNYAVENYEFALSIEPDNQAVKQRLQEVTQAQRQGRHTVPSTMLQERQTNPFLRADKTELRTALGMLYAEPAEVFAELRRRKDVF